MAAVHDGPRHFVAGETDEGQRLDRFLAEQLPDISRSQIQRLLREGHVTVSRGRPKPGLEVTIGLEVDVVIPAPETATPAPENVPLAIVHDDEDLVVVNKPAGMVAHPSAGHTSGTLVNALLHHVRGLSGVGGQERPGIVHRLDRGTSGLMVVAKHDRAHQALSAQFQQRTVDKRYVALVWGHPEPGRTFDSPIGRDPNHRQRMSSRGRRTRPAMTRLLTAELLHQVALVELSIATGRTHQIRVHLAEAHHPVVGDATYGGVRKVPPRLAAVRSLERPFLHAAHLAFDHPRTGERVGFDAPLPADLKKVLATLRRAGRAIS